MVVNIRYINYNTHTKISASKCINFVELFESKKLHKINKLFFQLMIIVFMLGLWIYSIMLTRKAYGILNADT